MPSHSDQQLSNLNIHVFPNVATYQYAVQQSEVGATDICLIEGTPGGGGGSTVSVTQGDSSLGGSLVGDVTVNNVTTHLYVKPATSGILAFDSGRYTGAVRPIMSTTGLLDKTGESFAYIGYAESGNSTVGKITKVYTNLTNCQADLIAIPVLTDVNIDSETGRCDSVPYIVLPGSLLDESGKTITELLDGIETGGIGEEPKV